MTAEIEALLRERAGYVARNLPARAAQVDAALAVAGHQPAPSTGDDSDDKPVSEQTSKRGRPRKAD